MTIRALLAGLAAAGLVLSAATGAHADPLKCQRGLAKASAKYVQGRAKALDKCERGKTKGQFPPATVCTSETKTVLLLGKLDIKLTSSIAKSCGGDDKICGNGDDDALASIGWGSVPNCPDFESSGCTNAIGNCTDITICLKCIHNVAVDQAIDLYYAELLSGEFGSNSAVNKCQQAIGKATVKFLGARSKALQKCWDARLKGLHAMTCPADGTGKTNLLISKAETKKIDTICKACGGPDKLCDGNADLSPAAIGFVASCPPATTFDSTSCGAPVGTALDIVTCVDCITEFKTDCMDAVAVPAFASPLNGVCNPNATTTSTSISSSTTSASSTTIATTSSTSSSTSPSTSTSSSTSSSTSTSSTTSTSTTTSTTTTTGGGATAFDFLSTAGTGTCGNTFRDTAGTIPLKNLLCANLSLGGGVSQVPDNSTPPGATNRFGLSCVGPACTVGPLSPATAAYDCSNTNCFFGTPLPISNAGLSVCVTNTFSAPVSGTLNTTTGDLTMNFQLNSATVLTGLPTQPCPRCSVSVGGAACVGSVGSPCTGVCDGSPNQGAVCTTKNPSGLTGGCPAPAATPAQQKCYRGTSNNGNCNTGADCPGGLCAQFIGNIAISLNPLTTGTATLSNATGIFCPGQTATQKGAFRSDICKSTSAFSGAPCSVTGTSDAEDLAHCGAGLLCRPGTLNNYCSAGTNIGKGCVLAGDCGVSGVCSRAGTLVQLIREIGVPTGALTVGVPKTVKLASSFCVGATTNGTVNGNANLPAAGATSVVGTVTLIP